MEYRTLGASGLRVSAVSFGAGPVPALLTGGDRRQQRRTIARAVEAGINWFDTAATYGEGRSEQSLGAALAELDAASRVHVATKVRLAAERMADIRGAVRESVHGSLERLGIERIALVQLHNSITRKRGDEHTSITPRDVLEGGVLEAFEELRSEGLVEHLGLTGLGHPDGLAPVLSCRRFSAVQVTYNLLNPSAGQPMPPGFDETDYSRLIDTCAGAGAGVIAIRVLAGGALADQPPSQHTLTTKFFPLELYQRDRRRAARLGGILPAGLSVKEAAVRFVLGNPQVSTALVGFASPEQVDEVLAYASAGPLPPAVVARIEEQWAEGPSAESTSRTVAPAEGRP